MSDFQTQLFAELNRDQLRACASDGLVVLPIGATEQHGPHLPTGTDVFQVEWIARAAAAQIAGQVPAVVTPTLPFGSSRHHLPFGATLSLSADTLWRVLKDLCSSLVESGFRRLFIINGHGGNQELVELVAKELPLELPVHVGAGSWWVMAWEQLASTNAFELGRVPGHAGAFETSAVLAMRPELVQEPRPERAGPFPLSDRGHPSPPFKTELHGSWLRIDGYSDSPAGGSAELGSALLEAAVRGVAAGLIKFFQDAVRLAVMVGGSVPDRLGEVCDQEVAKKR